MKAAKSSNGRLEIADVPIPEPARGEALIRTAFSAISSGTEVTALQRGLTASLGYSGAGIVEAIGTDVDYVRPGDTVACYGVPTHAERILASRHHIVRLPDKVSLQAGAFAGIGTIALHGVRQADLRLEETVVVLGLGLIGQLTVQLAVASGLRVLACDTSESRCERANAMAGVFASSDTELLQKRLQADTNGNGADCVMICAGTKSAKLIDQSLGWLRYRGKIVIVGDTNTEFDRNLLFHKEAQLTISRAGGPGRYDPAYEKEGRDYPYGLVRWTLHRNMEAFVRLLSDKKLNLDPLITDQFLLENLEDAYRKSKERADETMGMLVCFP